jgi:aspartate-semialdehyde dehydrogenase
VDRLRVAVLGATGLVGQRLVSMLHGHPWFELGGLYASTRHGARYSEAVDWVLEKPLPGEVGEMRVERVDPDAMRPRDYDILFSALPSSAALELEPLLARKGFTIVSNSSPFRLDGDVPLVVPEINPGHLALAGLQSRRGWSGRLYKVPNCTTIILSISLKPLMDRFGLARVIASSMQAVSGAGLRGLPSMYIIGNMIPFIEGEEAKIERETLKILGELDGERVKPPGFKVSASAHRIPVIEGHTVAVFAETLEKPEPGEVARVMEGFEPRHVARLSLPSAPDRLIRVRREESRPQPRLDALEGGGMTIVVGRIREDPVVGGVKYVVLGSNTIRGAAGNAVLMAELLAATGLLEA